MSTQTVTPIATPISFPMDELPVSELRASATNPRRTFDPAALADLQASIAQHGIIEKLLVRPMVVVDDANVPVLPDAVCEADFYEIVGGERRWRSAVALGHESVPVTIRMMTDAQAAEAAITSNLQRVDIAPMEEAEAFQDLLERLGSIPAVAARVGKEQRYVAKSLKLMTLTLPSRDALRGKLITIDHAFLLAVLAEAEQNAALKWTLDHSAGVKVPVEKVIADRLARVTRSATPVDEEDEYDEDEGEQTSVGRRRFAGYVWEPQSVARLKSWIGAESGIVLDRAPWSLADEDYLLPDVGPCAECPKNSNANAPLFGDLEMGVAVCTDGACFAAKTVGFVHIELRKQGFDDAAKPKLLVPRLSWKFSSVKPALVSVDVLAKPEVWTANPAKLLKKGQWIEAKPGSCKYVRPGVTADWSDDGDRGYMGGAQKLRKPGEVLQVCIAAGCKVHRKDWEKPKSASGNHYVKPDPEAEKRAREERDHVEKVETKIRSTMLYAILAKLDAKKAVKIVADRQRGAAEWRKRMLAVMPELNGETLEAFVVFCSEFGNSISPNGYWLMQPGGVANDRKTIFELAKLAGLDGPQLVAKYFHDQGSIAPASDRLYPKGIPWPKGSKQAESVAAASPKKAVAKKAAPAKAAPKKAAKPVAKKAVKKAVKK